MLLIVHTTNSQAQREQKKQEQSDRKEASKLLLLEEEESQPKSKAGGATKATRAEIAAAQKRDSGATVTALPKGITEGPLIEENPNQLLRERQLEGEEEARTVEEAITLLSVGKEPSEKHPERRLKAAYTAFEERELPRLKAENPNLRLSQLKQILRKDWMKSPENPLNQHFMAYNEKT